MAHNLYAEAIGELGIVGSAALAGLVLAIYKNASRCIAARRVSVVDDDEYLVSVATAVRDAVLLYLVAGFAGARAYSYLPVWLAAFAGVIRLLADERLQLAATAVNVSVSDTLYNGPQLLPSWRKT